jgi:hypothetical protein
VYGSHLGLILSPTDEYAFSGILKDKDERENKCLKELSVTHFTRDLKKGIY